MTAAVYYEIIKLMIYNLNISRLTISSYIEAAVSLQSKFEDGCHIST